MNLLAYAEQLERLRMMIEGIASRADNVANEVFGSTPKPPQPNKTLSEMPLQVYASITHRLETRLNELEQAIHDASIQVGRFEVLTGNIEGAMAPRPR